MAIPSRLKSIVKACAGVLIYLAFSWTFLAWMFRLMCKPLSGLASENISVPPIPPGAGCYSTDHGRVLFSNYATVAEDPVPFVLMTGVLLILGGAIGYWLYRDRRASLEFIAAMMESRRERGRQFWEMIRPRR
jgi:hypothetical protein